MIATIVSVVKNVHNCKDSSNSNHLCQEVGFLTVNLAAYSPRQTFRSNASKGQTRNPKPKVRPVLINVYGMRLIGAETAFSIKCSGFQVSPPW